MRLDTPPLRRFGRRIGRPAPLVTLAILLASPAVLARQAMTAEDLERQAAIVAGMDAVPFQITWANPSGGDAITWAGDAVPIPTDQQEILHANALLSRRYTAIGERGVGASVTMLLVHCSDVRDMDGHWPLHCYPRSGWRLSSFTPGVKVRSPERVDTDFAWARFSISDGGGAAQRIMTVLFTFLLPEGRVEMDMGAVSDRSKRKSDSSKGVAQIQFVFSGDVPPERCVTVAEQLLTGVPQSLREKMGMPMVSAPNSTPTTTMHEKKEPGDG
jgi:hypothetical protein